MLQVDPWCEAAHRRLMLALVHSGQRDAALRLYQLCRQLLADERGVEPEPETTALYQQIQSGVVVRSEVSQPS